MHFLAQNVAQNLPENAKNHTVPAALGQLAACDGMSEAYLLDKLAEAKDAAGLTQL